jgi:hypothetical protein
MQIFTPRQAKTPFSSRKQMRTMGAFSTPKGEGIGDSAFIFQFEVEYDFFLALINDLPLMKNSEPRTPFECIVIRTYPCFRTVISALKARSN